MACDPKLLQRYVREGSSEAVPGVGAPDAEIMYPRLPALDRPAPHFEAETTHGVRSLSTYRGRWLLLFSHPADFTPVCTTEFIAFAKAYDTFQDLDCDLLGLSIDSVYAHIAWVLNIEKTFGVEIPFPIIADLSMAVASAYGMVHQGASDTSPVRATFLIDPDGILRAMIYYPMSNGRSVDELIRLLQALQTSDAQMVATPEGWRPGEPVILPPPRTVMEAKARAAEATCDASDWYFATKKIT